MIILLTDYGTVMEEKNEESLVCAQCENDVKKNDDFCPSCEELFLDDTLCDNHDNVLAQGVCIICSVPFCLKCGLKVNNHFLCNEHSAYEIYQGMARIYGTLDDLDAQYKKTCLEQEGLHSLLFCRHQPKGGPEIVYPLFEAEGDFWGNIVNEIKVMVPSQEVLRAEELLK